MTMTMIARIRTVGLLACLVVGISARPVAAQDLGGRLGVSGDPTQFYLGLHSDFGQVIPQLNFKPNFEAGFGDNVQVYAFNIEFVYPITLTGSQANAPWKPYILAGPALIVAHASVSVAGFSASSTNTGGGFNIGFGLTHTRGLFTEIKIGVADSPSFKFGVGMNFR